MINTDWLRDALLPDDGPPDDIYRKAVPAWCRQSHDELAERIGEEYGCGFAAGFEGGLIMSNLRPEWSRGLYLLLREHYLSTHEPEDLLDWEWCAEETARAIPVTNAGFASESRETKLALELPDHIDTTAYRSGVRRIIMSKHTRKERR